MAEKWSTSPHVPYMILQDGLFFAACSTPEHASEIVTRLNSVDALEKDKERVDWVAANPAYLHSVFFRESQAIGTSFRDGIDYVMSLAAAKGDSA